MLKKILDSTRIKRILDNGHWQTIIPLILTNQLIKVEYLRQRVYTPDNDFIDLDWVNPDVVDKPTVILFPGMEGSSDSHYAKRVMYYLKQIGWRGVVAHARGCSGELNLTFNFYHGGFTTDLAFVIETVKKVTPAQLFVTGVSLSGNMLLKLLGENNPAANLLNAAIAISVPFDLMAASLQIDSGLNRRLYVPYFLKSLLPKMKQYAEKYPDLKWQKVDSLDEFNDKYITQMYRFKSAIEYYQKSSSKFFIDKIKQPTMIIQSANDPMIPFDSWPDRVQLPDVIKFVGLNYGGHAGFVGNNEDLLAALLKLPKIMVQYYSKHLD
jgi:predicted alpha/beta-fold hydrolase